MRKFLIATHGNFSSGIKSAADIIAGKMDNVYCIEAYVKENVGIEDEVLAVLDQVKADDELVILTDIVGGSVTNQILQCRLKNNVHIVSGINLPLLLELFLSDETDPIEELLENAIQNAKDQMVYVNKLIELKREVSEDD